MMMRAFYRCGIAALMAATAPCSGTAQSGVEARAPFATSLETPAPASYAVRQSDGWRPLRLAKWGTAAASAGLALYGFTRNNRADDLYRELEQMCVADADRCQMRGPGGAYVDAEMETRYQEIRSIDRRARTALIAGQVGVAASVLLFILDLRNGDSPDNIPYEPRGLNITPARDGSVELRWSVIVR